VQQARLQVAQAKARLQLLLGRKTPSDALDVTGTLRRDSVMETEPELQNLALIRRPDVQLAAGQQARTTADIRLQLANGRADYVVGTDYVRQSAYGISGSSLGVYFSMPLQIFNRNQGEIARAQRERSQADAKMAALQASVTAEIAQAYRQYTTAQNLLESTEGDLLQRAKSVRDTTEYAYQRGEASLIEFLDAQRAFNDATQTYNDARASYARSLYQLDAASGAAVSTI
jgi:cobalt-zinc-cadmium efflux system outer membrane protein